MKLATTWSPSPPGQPARYTATLDDAIGTGVTLSKSGKTWIMSLSDGRTFDLGRKATFDHAEGILAGL